MLSAALVDDLMKRFGKGFMRADADLLAQSTTDDFEWHFAAGPDSPDGKVFRGVAGVMQGIAENRARYENLRFNDVEYYPAGDDKFVMTARVTGTTAENGKSFDLRAIELYTVRDDLIAKKDVFWKQSTD
jgi:ketosteroid isomerase-like protein